MPSCGFCIGCRIPYGRLFQEILPCGLCIGGNTGTKSVQGIETDFVPEMLIEFQPKGLSVEVALKVEDTGFNRHIGSVVDCRTGTDVGDRGFGLSVGEPDLGNVNAVTGDQDMGRND